MRYEVIPDPTEKVPTWRVIVGGYATTAKHHSERAAYADLRELVMGVRVPEFGERPVRVSTSVVIESDDIRLTRTEVEHEAFTFTTIYGDVITWDITHAREQVRTRQIAGLHEIPRDVLAEIAAANEWTQAGVDAADVSRHGISAPLVANGRVVYILIDGTHRAVRALQTNKPFCVWLLTDEGNRDCIVNTTQPALVP